MHVTPKPGARRGMTLASSPNHFACYSERVRWLTRGEVRYEHDPRAWLVEIPRIVNQQPYRRGQEVSQ